LRIASSSLFSVLPSLPSPPSPSPFSVFLLLLLLLLPLLPLLLPLLLLQLLLRLLLLRLLLLLLLSLQLLCTRRAGTSCCLRLAHCSLRGMGRVCFWGLPYMLADGRLAKKQGRRASSGHDGGQAQEPRC
jgi:hypothetical protein